MREPRAPRLLALVPFTLALTAAPAATQERSVYEPFTWKGAHAATIGAKPAPTGAFANLTHDCAPADHADKANAANATTVWWNTDRWDARGDTSFPAISNPPATGYHVDVHKAATADPTDGREDNSVYAVGGDGSPGVAAMRMDYQGISSARLRNPMLISAARPGVVSFYATAFLTTAHWWEIAITPTDVVAGAELTAVPSVEDGLDGPFAESAGTPGPGHRPALDSINVIGTGSSDVPCSVGWSTRFAVTRSLGGVTTDAFNPITAFSQLIQTDPSEIEELYLWRIEFRPNRVDLLVDHDRNGVPELLETFDVTIPWSEVYVHFMAVTYQADHHPQEPCYLGPVREFVWRDLRVSPVKYDRTLVFPKENGTENLPRDTGWLSYDLRDIQRYGGEVNGVPQANPVAFDQWTSLLYCSMPMFYCPDPRAFVLLEVELPASALGGLGRAQLVYDIRSPITAGTATLIADYGVSYTEVGNLPGRETAPGAASTEWVRRSIDVPIGLLRAGSNSFGITLTGDVELDRLQLELAVDDPTPLFADGFESGDVLAWTSSAP